jgi:hypothetical protein
LLTCFRLVISELHPQKVIHVWAERLSDPQRHFRRQRSIIVQKVGKRSAKFPPPSPP